MAKIKEITLSLGDVTVSLSGSDKDLDMQALSLIDILLEKYRKEMKFSLPGKKRIQKKKL